MEFESEMNTESYLIQESDENLDKETEKNEDEQETDALENLEQEQTEYIFKETDTQNNGLRFAGQFDNIKCNRKTGVYVKVNSEGFITEVNSDIFITNFDGWIKIDEGEGDRFDHAQALYFDTPLIDELGNYTQKM